MMKFQSKKAVSGSEIPYLQFQYMYLYFPDFILLKFFTSLMHTPRCIIVTIYGVLFLRLVSPFSMISF